MNRNANTIFGFVAAAVLILSGCINNVDTETGGNSNVPDGKCSLTVDSGFSARAAFPSSLAADMVYAAEISYSSSGAKKWLGADSLENSPAVLRNSPSASGEIRFVFCAPEESAEYTITVFACPAGTSVGSAADVENAAAASGQAEFRLKAGQKALETPVKVSLSPVTNKTASGKGKVNLPLSFDPALRIVAAEVNVTKDGVSDSGENNYGFKIEVSGNSATLSAESAPAGTYLAIMKFYNSTSTEVAVNSAVQQVSVYPGMTTDCWFIDGKKHGTTAADGTFKPSALELTKYDFTELYVCGTDGGGESGGKRSFYVSSNFDSSVPDASDTAGDGSMAKPFATVQKAVDTIAVSGDTSKKYTIYVDGTVEPLYADTDFGDSGTFISISIGTTASNLDLTIKGLSADSRAVLNAKQKDRNHGRVLTSENTSLTLENLKITGGKQNDFGGIYIKSGNLTLKNCVVTKNESSNGGGGIHFDGKNLIVEGSEISGNKGDPGGICVAEGSAKTKIEKSKIIDNSASSGGGGLKLAGTSTIEGCDISGNKAESSTGGVGGGLILSIDNKSCKIKNSVINDNTAGGSGGGIYMIDGELILGSGAVIGKKLDPDVAENNISKVATSTDFGNKSTDTSYSRVGAGLYVRYGTVNMSEGAYICKNYTSSYGGGVYVSPEGKFNMSGGVIGWNFSRMGGGIIADGADDDSSNYSVLNISGKAKICYNKAGFTSVQGCTGRGAGIFACGDLNISGNAEIFGNYAEKSGAGIHSEKKLVMTGGSAHDNEAGTDGAGIYIYSGKAELSSCTIKANKAGGNGGAIYANNENSRIIVKIGEEDSSDDDVLIEKNSANRGGAFYGANNADFVMNVGKVSENYSTGINPGNGGGAMFIWGGDSNYSTFTMNGGVISGNMAKNGGAGGAVHIDHGSGGMAAFIMTGGLLSGNKAADENGTGSNLGGAIYVKNGGQIKLGGSAVIEVKDDGNDIWLAEKSLDNKEISVKITGKLAPGNNATAGNQKYTARITPQTYTVGKELITADSGVTLDDEVGKFCVTGNAESAEWFITSEGKLSKPAAISSLLSSPDFSIYPKLTVSSDDEINKLAELVNAGNTMEGVTITLQNDVTLGSMIGSSGKRFCGTFDGNGKTITSTAGLNSIFYHVEYGRIKNVISKGEFLNAGIAYYCNYGIIENCKNNARISESDGCGGGIVGQLIYDSKIKNCINNGYVTGIGDIGGIAGQTFEGSSILNCINLGEIKNTNTGSGADTGGIVGNDNASSSFAINNCVNVGTVAGNGDVDAIIGGLNKAVIKNSYYLSGSASSRFGSSFDSSFKTTRTLTVEGTTSNNLIDLLNAWVDVKNSSGEEQYLSWDIVDGNPSLVY